MPSLNKDFMKALYQYFYNTLVQANLKKDESKVDEVLRHLVDLRATWKQAMNMVKPETSQTTNTSGDTYVSNDEDDDEEDDDEDEGTSYEG